MTILVVLLIRTIPVFNIITIIISSGSTSLALGAEDDEVKDQPHCHLQDERHQRPKYPADRKVKIDHLDEDLAKEASV